MRLFKTSIMALSLAASASFTFAQSGDGKTSITSTITRTRTSTYFAASASTSAHTSFSSSEVPSSTTPLPVSTLEAGEYYPTDNGQIYTDTPTGTADHSADNGGGGPGKSDAFMGNKVGVQIGIIAGVVALAIAMFIGMIIYYFRRRKQWEREVKRRSALPMNAKIIVTRKGEVKLAQRGSSESQVGLEELEKGGHKIGSLEGEKKPGIFKMLLGKF